MTEKISKDKAYIILTPNTPRRGDVGFELINYTEDPSVDAISHGIKWLVTSNTELLYYIGAREMELQVLNLLAQGKVKKNNDPSLH